MECNLSIKTQILAHRACGALLGHLLYTAIFCFYACDYYIQNRYYHINKF